MTLLALLFTIVAMFGLKTVTCCACRWMPSASPFRWCPMFAIQFMVSFTWTADRAGLPAHDRHRLHGGGQQFRTGDCRGHRGLQPRLAGRLRRRHQPAGRGVPVLILLVNVALRLRPHWFPKDAALSEANA